MESHLIDKRRLWIFSSYWPLTFEQRELSENQIGLTYTKLKPEKTVKCMFKTVQPQFIESNCLSIMLQQYL